MLGAEGELISVSLEEARQQVRLVKGVDKEVEKLKFNLGSIQAVLVDAEQRQLKDQSVRLWLDRIKYASYDMEDVLDEWVTARRKLQFHGGFDDENVQIPPKKPVCSLFPNASCFGFKQVFLRHDIAMKIKGINENLDDISKAKDMFNFNVIRSTPEKSERIPSTSLIDVSEVRGRDEEKNILKSKLLCESSEEQKAVQIISLVGMGGIGKTTLAQNAYCDNDVINNFEKMIWVCVSDPFDEFRVAKAIVEAIEGSACNLSELQSLLKHIDVSIAGKKFFLVLDDVWSDDYRKWEPFHRCLMNGLCGSKILVTTRKETVARMMESTDVISIKELSEQECWALFKRFAFFGRPHSDCEQFEEIGRKIVGKCKGLPLAAKTMGSALRFKRTREEWESVLDSELWQLEEFEKGLLAPLLLSYNDLPSKIKQCFLYCAVFPKDYHIGKDELIKLWMALGYIVPKENKDMEMIGEEYFDYLVSRSFFQDFMIDHMGNVEGCKMHDIVHDFAHFLTKDECVIVEVDDEEEPLSLTYISPEKLRHSMLELGFKVSFPVSIFNAKKLRSILIHNNSHEDLSRVPRGFLDQLTCLRALRITEMDTTNEVLQGIKKLIHLRYLEFFGIEKEVPEICCELFNLQTLDISGYSRWKRLPQGIGKLVNLRHLIFHCNGLEYMPKGIERLTCLRTLSEFVVSPSGKYGNKACNLEGMRNLNHLRGTLRIRGLGNLTDVNEAKIAHLEKKKNLVHLDLLFDTGTEEAKTEGIMEENEANHEAVGEALRAPPNLESLVIQKYKGKAALPSWIVSLNYLKKLYILYCSKCEIMPPLGKLPLLEILGIRYMRSVKRVGDEFLGVERDCIDGPSSSVIAFPKLEKLTFCGLYEFETWNFVKKDIAIMPQLKSMVIEYCGKLNSVPDQLLRSTTLMKFWISGSPILAARFKKETGEDWLKISHIPNIQIEFDSDSDTH